MLDGLTCVYRSNVDLYFYVMGSSHENEVICIWNSHLFVFQGTWLMNEYFLIHKLKVLGLQIFIESW